MRKKQVRLYKVNFGNRDRVDEENVLGVAVPLDWIADRLDDLGCDEVALDDEVSPDKSSHGSCIDWDGCPHGLWLEAAEEEHVFDYFDSDYMDEYIPRVHRKLDLQPDEIRVVLEILEYRGLYRHHNGLEYIAGKKALTLAVWTEVLQEAVEEAMEKRDALYVKRARQALATRKLEEGEPIERAIDIENLRDFISLKETGLRPPLSDIRLMLEAYDYLTESDGQWFLSSKFHNGAISQAESWNVDSESSSRKEA